MYMRGDVSEINPQQFGDRWIPRQKFGYQIKNHLTSMHFQVRESEGHDPSQYDSEAWHKIHDDLHANDKMSKPHKHFVPKDKR